MGDTSEFPAPGSIEPCKIYVGNVGEEVRKTDLKTEFDKYGNVTDIYITSGCAFITFESDEMADEAVKNMDGFDFNGAKLRVERSRARGRGRGGYDRGGRGRGGYESRGRGGYESRGRGGYDSR